MKTKALATCLLVILTVASFGVITPVQGDPEEGDWFTSYRIEDPRTGQLMVEVDFDTKENRSIAPVFGGSEILIKFTVNVPETSYYNILKLRTNLIQLTRINSTLTNSTLTNSTLTNSTLTNSTLTNSIIVIPYWELLSKKYKVDEIEPNSTEVVFRQVKGELTMKLSGKVPVTATGNGPVRYVVIGLYDIEGEILDEIKVTVETAVMDEYQALLTAREISLQIFKDGGADPKYIELYGNIINESKVQSSLGYYYSAISMLKALDISEAPAYSPVGGLFLPVVGALTAVIIVLGILLGLLLIRERKRRNTPRNKQTPTEPPPKQK
jgi:hypothetical protein